MWASGGFGRNSSARGGEWNYAIDPDANEKTLDWKAFLGSAPKRAFEPARYFRWRKYWDYSGGIATDLFYHTMAPLIMTTGVEFPVRVAASGGIYVQKDREVPDTFFMNVDYRQLTMQLACSVTSGVGAPLIIHGSEATLFVAQDSEAFNNTAMEIVPDRDYKDAFVKKTGSEKLSVEVQPFVRGEHPHMDNFLDVRAQPQGAQPVGRARLQGDGRHRHGRPVVPRGQGPAVRQGQGTGDELVRIPKRSSAAALKESWPDPFHSSSIITTATSTPRR